MTEQEIADAIGYIRKEQSAVYLLNMVLQHENWLDSIKVRSAIAHRNVELELKEVQNTIKLRNATTRVEYLDSIGYKEQLKADGVYEMLNEYGQHKVKTTTTNTQTLNAFARYWADDMAAEADRRNGIDQTEEYYQPVRC